MKKVIENKELKAIKIIRDNLVINNKIPSVRKLMVALGYRSPRSAFIIIEKLKKKGILKQKENGNLQFIDINCNEIEQTISVPLLGSISCGIPIFAEENIEATIPVSLRIAKPPYQYFLLRAKGDSMDKKGIDNGDFVLIRKQNTANDGDNIVALIDNEVTIKEFYKTSQAVVLKPCSFNTTHKPIILKNDFLIQGIVIATIPKLF